MAFLSEILGHTITDIDGHYVGKLEDLIAREFQDATHPIVDAVVIKDRNKVIILPYVLVMALFAPSIPLKCRVDEITSYHPAANDIFLSRDVLDKQIIDTDGARVVRVNDLELVRVNGTLYVGNVDIGMLGILRRLGVAEVTRRITATFRLPAPQTFISWDDVELLRHDPFMRLRVPVEKISELHPADVAEIISDMNKLESGQLLEALNMEQLADTLEEVETEFQADLVENMSDEKVADILEEMEPDEAADLLAELPKERSRGLLALMEKEESEDVRKLLSYPEDSGRRHHDDGICLCPTERHGRRSDQVFAPECGRCRDTVLRVCHRHAGPSHGCLFAEGSDLCRTRPARGRLYGRPCQEREPHR